jgi:uncharacterized protein
MDLEDKAAALERELSGLHGLLVAYSGGTDSAYLAWAAWRALGDGMLAVIADSASLPRAELAAALEFTARHGIPTEILVTGELENPAYRRNDARRCFYCKDELFGQMEAFRAARGFAHLAYGRNVDDDGEFRPGQEAASVHRALAPLATAGLGKADVRELARRSGLELWDKPASACLASRIEYGRAVTRETLAQVEQAEAALRAMGFKQVRVRHHGEVARVEIAREELARALDVAVMEAMTAAVKAAGFRYAALDMQGYRTGSMNEVLPVSAIAPAGR